MKRRHFIHSSVAALTANALADHHGEELKKTEDLFDISLAQWSNHRALKGGQMTNMDWPEYTKNTYGILGLEYVNQFFKDKAEDMKYLGELKKRTSDLGMTNILIMVDGEGHLGAGSDEGRQKTIDKHKKWVTAAKFLGCHSIRVNAFGAGNREEAAKLVVDGLTKLSTFAKDHNINVIVENHGGLSSDGQWLQGVLKKVNMPNCGSLPDFGNFHKYDRYKGITELMPFAKGVSAKTSNFEKNGEASDTNYTKAMKIVLDAGYRGYVGVEYQGKKISEDEGIIKTRDLLIKVRKQLSSEYQ